MQHSAHPATYFQVQIERWKEKRGKSSGPGRKSYCQHMLSELNQDETQFQEVRNAFDEQGFGLVLKSWKNWCVIMRDHESPTLYRFQVFNESGLVAHCVKPSSDSILLEAFQAGFRVVDDRETLHRLSRNPAWSFNQVSFAMPSASI